MTINRLEKTQQDNNEQEQKNMFALLIYTNTRFNRDA